MKVALGILSSLLVVGCTNDSVKWIAGFDPPPVQEGFTRFVTPTVKDLQPGANEEWCQWLAGPESKDRDVLAFSGEQSRTGHHAALYATTETNFKVGESHVCTTADMVSISFVGAIAGTGADSLSQDLPAGLYFRVPAGMALMANTHWLNATDDTVDGQAVLDVKFAPPSSDRVIADLFANNTDAFTVAPDSNTSFDVSCVLPQGLNIAMVANHMHTLGASAYSEIIHADGTKEMVVSDDPWNPESQFNPSWVPYSVATPLVAVAGDTYHTHCEWSNPGSTAVNFPDEMCTGIGFYFPSQGQLTCNDGTWLTGGPGYQ